MNRAFRDIALEYCAWVEKRQVREKVEVWLPQILAEMICVIYNISDDGRADAGANEDGFKARDHQEVTGSLPNLPFQYYREGSNLLDLESEEVEVADLYDDISDIYHDLNEGLFLYEKVSANEAERYWRQSFRYHWGDHATRALRALYLHFAKGMILRPIPRE